MIAIDNLITGNPANIAHLDGNDNYRFIKHNVSNFIMLKESITFSISRRRRARSIISSCRSRR